MALAASPCIVHGDSISPLWKHLSSLLISQVKYQHKITELYEFKSQETTAFFSPTSNDIKGNLCYICTDVYLYASASVSCAGLLFFCIETKTAAGTNALKKHPVPGLLSCLSLSNWSLPK